MARRSEAVIAERVGEETVVLDLEDDVALRLNGTGSLLWEALARPSSVGELAGELERRYGIGAERALNDATAFVADLQGVGLVRLVRAAAAPQR